MATVIVTNPAASLTINDPTPADTITVTDGPAENGFQTTQTATTGTTTIFANQAVVTIDGGNHGDAVVLDNPDPAAGMQSLTIQNLGTGSTINGGNPNANSPDIAVASLTLTADKGIGTNRALRTQVGTLNATATSGGINIANGAAAPVTLNVTGLQALFGMPSAGGPITVVNNGTINDTGGIGAFGNISITATGATADLNTGSGNISNTQGISLAAGEDINLGDANGPAFVSAASGLTLSAGRNISLNANTGLTSSLGNISLTAGGNIAMLTSPGGRPAQPEIVNNGPGGTIALNAGPGHTLTIDSTGATAVQSNNGNITLVADAMVINKAVNAGTARFDLLPASLSGLAIVLGGANAPGVLGITQAELNQITAGVTQIGANVASNITIAAPISNPTNSNVLTLINAGTISETAFGALTTPNLRIGSTGPVTLNNPNNSIGAFAANVTGSVTVNNGTNTLAVPNAGVDGVLGISTSNSAVNLTADNMTIQQIINAGTGSGAIVTLAPFTSTLNVTLGTASVAGSTFGLTNGALGWIASPVLRVDAGSGNITITNAINRTPTSTAPSRYQTLSLSTGGSIGQNATLSVANLALTATAGITLTNSGNTVDTLAFNNTGGAVSFTNSSGNALTIGAVDGITQSSNIGGTTTIETGGDLTFAAGLSSSDTVTLTSDNGSILDGDNGADVDVTAPTLVLSAGVGIGTAAHPLQTQVTTLNVSQGGGIFINNGAAAPTTLNIGGGGIHAKGPGGGTIVVTNNGTINGTINSTSNGSLITTLNLNSAAITLKALGANADLNIGGQQLFADAVSSGGPVDLEAGRDINLGGSVAPSYGAVRGGSIAVQAGRNFTINPNANFNSAHNITVSAGGDFTMLTSPASINGAPVIFSGGGTVALSAGAGHTMTLASTGTNAVTSNGGNITLTADAMTINAGVNAGGGNVLIQPVTAGQLIDLGTLSATFFHLSNAALNEITANTLTIGSATAGALSMAGNVAPANVTNLTLNTGSNFTAIATTLNIGAGVLTIGFDEQNFGAVADLSGATITAGTVIVNSGSGNDTIITGAGPETINGGGGVDTAVFSGTLAQYAINAAGGVVTVTTGGVTDTLTGIKFLQFSDQTILATPVAVSDNASFVSFDGNTDILFRSPSGQLAYWSTQNGQIQSIKVLGNAPATAILQDTGDFNGDGHPDLLFRDSNSGQIATWDTVGGQISSINVLGNAPASAQIAGTGDFNHDGTTDILFRDSNTGQIATWDVVNNQITSINVLGSAPSSFHIVGIADLNHDGTSDILFRDSNTGQLAYWLVQNNQLLGAPQVLGSASTDFHLVGTGDFAGNGNTDLLFASNTTGQVVEWLLNGTQIQSIQTVGTAPAGYHIVGTGDLNGDGKADIVFRNDAGNVQAWLMNGANILSTQTLGSADPSVALAIHHFDFV